MEVATTFSAGMFEVDKIDNFNNEAYKLIFHINHRTRCYVDINGTRYKIRHFRYLNMFDCECILYEMRWEGKKLLFADELTPRRIIT
jgi:hypothetical protein